MATEYIDVSLQQFNTPQAMADRVEAQLGIEQNSIPGRFNAYRIVGRQVDMFGRVGFVWLVLDAWHGKPAIAGALYLQFMRPEFYHGLYVQDEMVRLHSFEAGRRRTAITAKLIRGGGVGMSDIEAKTRAILQRDFDAWVEEMLAIVRRQGS